MIFDIEDYQEPLQARLYLARPDGKVLGELNEHYQLRREVSLGSVSRIEFALPYRISKFNKPTDNPNIGRIKDRYTVKFVEGETVHWYVIKNPTDNMTDSADYKTVEAFSLEIELADKRIRSYEAVSKKASQVLQDALGQSIWSIGTVDASFDVLYRSFSVTDSSVLDFIYEIARTFNALATFDTVNRKVSFLRFETYGVDEGLEVSYGVLLKNARKVENSDEFYTRLIGIGADGIGIQGQNVTGQNFIEDFSHFMYPFSRDANGNVLSHSAYMSDGLCHALLDYKVTLASSQGAYQAYLTQLSGYQSTLAAQESVLRTLQTDLTVLEDQISVANANGLSTLILVQLKESKQGEINSQQALVTGTKANIASVQANIANLQTTLSMDANFTPEQLIELNPYIIVGVFENSNVTDSKQLYDLMVEEFDKLKQPKLIVEIGIVNFMKCVTEKKRWNRLRLGNLIRITNTQVGIDVKAKIMGYTVDYESDDISLTISNVKELLTDEARVLRDLYRSNSTSGIVTSNLYKWNAAASDVNEVQSILNGVWDATARSIVASNNESVEISRKGIITKDLSDPDRYVVIQHGQIALTQNGGNTWSTVMNSEGVYAQRLIGQIVAGTDLTITNSGGTFTVNSSGVTITGSSLSITGGLPESQINGTSVSKWNAAEANAKQYTDGQLVAVNGVIADLSSDNKLTGFEKQQVKGQWDVIAAEKPTLDAQATAYGITTEKTNLTNSYNTLNTYLTPLLANLTVTSDIVGLTLRQNFSDYYDKRALLLKAISDKAVQVGVSYNNVVISSANGIQVIDTNVLSKTVMDKSGFRIQKNIGTTGSPTWSNQFSVDPNGDAIFAGIVSIGSGSSILKADSNGLYLGSSSFSSAPFRVSPSGTLTASSINLTGGSMGWGNFSVNSAGVITATGANISGNITASSLVANASISAPNINGGSIIGSTIQTSASTSVRRIVLNGSQLQSLNGTTKDGFTLDGSTGSLLFYSNGSITGEIYKGDNGFGVEALSISHKNVYLYGIDTASLTANDALYIGSSASTTYFSGTLNFNGASIQGLHAVFA